MGGTRVGEGIRRVGGGRVVGWGGRVASNPDSHGKTTQKPSKQPGDDPSPRQEEAETQKSRKWGAGRGAPGEEGLGKGEGENSKVR